MIGICIIYDFTTIDEATRKELWGTFDAFMLPDDTPKIKIFILFIISLFNKVFYIDKVMID